jgi:hypothetical protein
VRLGRRVGRRRAPHDARSCARPRPRRSARPPRADPGRDDHHGGRRLHHGHHRDGGHAAGRVRRRHRRRGRRGRGRRGAGAPGRTGPGAAPAAPAETPGRPRGRRGHRRRRRDARRPLRLGQRAAPASTSSASRTRGPAGSSGRRAPARSAGAPPPGSAPAALLPAVGVRLGRRVRARAPSDWVEHHRGRVRQPRRPVQAVRAGDVVQAGLRGLGVEVVALALAAGGAPRRRAGLADRPGRAPTSARSGPRRSPS